MLTTRPTTTQTTHAEGRNGRTACGRVARPSTVTDTPTCRQCQWNTAPTATDLGIDFS